MDIPFERRHPLDVSGQVLALCHQREASSPLKKAPRQAGPPCEAAGSCEYSTDSLSLFYPVYILKQKSPIE